MLAVRVLVLLACTCCTAACTRHNPAACCTTVEECNQVGLTEIYGCEGSNVCNQGMCVAPQCATSADCMSPTPTCVDSLCVAGIDAAMPRIKYVLFTSDVDGNSEIYRMLPDGTSRTNLTSNSAQDQTPIWDPTGDHIAFTSTRSGSLELYTMSADGLGVVDVSQGSVNSFAWSPDGTRIVFTSSRSGTSELYTVQTNGTLLTPVTSIAAGASDGDWSPDGLRIAFVSAQRIYVMNADGSNPLPVSAGSDFHPRWKPDGSKIAFSHRFNLSNLDLFVIKPDGAGATNLTNTATGVEVNPSWSFDGAYLAGTGGADPDTEAFVVDSSGVTFTNLSMSPSSRDANPCWSPDGTQLIYESTRSGNYDLYRIPRGGGMSVNLTNSAGNETECSWRPR